MASAPAVSALIFALPLATALLLGCGRPRSRDGAAALALLATLASGGLTLSLGPSILAGDVLRWSVPWLPFPGAGFGLRIDGLAWIFLLLVTGIGSLVVLYARYYLPADQAGPRFFSLLSFFTGAMLGLVVADNLLLFTVWWELIGLASFLLIGFRAHQAEARRAARMAITITGAGGLALLAAVLVIGQVAGTFSLDGVLASGDAIRADARYPVVLALVLVAAFTKSAQVPFHFWLPKAMTAPTPVSAYLHSATLVKAGVFLLARLHPALSGTETWFHVVATVGLVTMLAGAWLAIFEHDLKGLLAYSTISHLGLITLLFGLDSKMATVAALFHTLNHGTFKAALFMAAGIIDHETGTRDMRRLGGLRRYLPVTATLAIVSSLAMAGVPLLNGFLSKEMFFAETLALRDPLARLVVPALATLASALTVAYSTRFVHDVFWHGEPRGLDRVPHEPPRWMVVPAGILAALCVLVGLWPDLLIGAPLRAAAAATLGDDELAPFSLAPWHGLSEPLVMSIVALFLGVLFYFSLQRLYRLHDRGRRGRGGADAYRATLAGLSAIGQRLTAVLDSGRTQVTCALVVAVALAAGWLPFLAERGPLEAVLTGPVLPGPWDSTLALVWLIGTIATVALLSRWRTRLLALILVGAVGLTVSLSFALLSAPDLALTQLLVEVASVVLLLLALRFLPETGVDDGTRLARAGRGTLAIGAGLGITALCWGVLTRPADAISGYFLENALPGAAGRNAVNVIIVDFRGLDTMGELTVLVIAAVIVGVLLHGLRPAAPVDAGAGRFESLLLRQGASLLLPFGSLVALFLFLRGHNAPGGGFIAGLVLASTLLLPYLARGATWTGERLVMGRGMGFWRLAGAGLGVAALTGLGAVFLGYPFLTSAHFALEVPLIGALSIPTAMFFDLGVFVGVTGATLLALTALGRLSPSDRRVST